jgi:hypothetical protein
MIEITENRFGIIDESTYLCIALGPAHYFVNNKNPTE